VGAGRARGLVNAVLRRVQPITDLARHDALDHPAWLVDRWTQRYGEAATDAWCARNAEPPPLTIVATGDFHPIDGLATDTRTVSPVTLHGQPLRGVWRVSGHEGPIPDLPGFAEGRFWVQDAASVAVADLVGASAGTTVLDACAAPGGKSFRMAANGASVTACDAVVPRLGLLEESAKRLGLSIRTIDVDWLRNPAAVDGEFDAVLVDAPCTALGTVRRNPEVRWRRGPDDPETYAATQLRILAAASVHTKPGGVLVYAVCSPEPA
jgi:16S rRNA (cytosine967-C5)-methyltransferase